MHSIENSKYIFVTGGVYSSLGKGITTASIAKLLKNNGYKVSIVKIDPYLNIDAGTMNPYQHGEVFVTEDGYESDLDLGHYERFLEQNMHSYNNITSGKVYKELIDEERQGKYLGQTVQIIPHLTNKIKEKIIEVSKRDNSEITLIEIGGTVGDIESLPYYEAARQMGLELPEKNVLYIHIAPVIYNKSTNELKTKPLQHSIQELRRIGINLDILIIRTPEKLSDEIKNKISLFSNIKKEYIFENFDVDNIYKVPLILKEQDLDKIVLSLLGLDYKESNLNDLRSYLNSLSSYKDIVNIGLVGKYVKLQDSYYSIKEALYHAGAKLNIKPNLIWIDSEDIEKNKIDLNNLELDGIIVLPGFGSRGVEGKIEAIKYARENKIPYLGICYGLQLAVVEYARNVIGWKDAHTTEVDPNTSHPVITLLDEQKNVIKFGGTMRLGSQEIILKENTIVYNLYGKKIIEERHRHRYEVNPQYINILEENGLIISGYSKNGLVEFIELDKNKHPFFVATQAHPEFKSRINKPAPLFLGLLENAYNYKIS